MTAFASSETIEHLLHQLALAFDAGRPATPKDDRAGYVRALKGFSDFVKAIGSPKYQRPLFRLAQALKNLDHGAVDPLLKPVETGGTKRHNVTSIWCARADVAVGVFALSYAGLTRKEAAEKAAKEFPAISRLAGVKRQIPASTAHKIIAWCEDFAKGETSKIKNRQARGFYHNGVLTVETLAKTADASPEQFSRVARSLFNKAVQAIRDS
jgi:hypothetical protein